MKSTEFLTERILNLWSPEQKAKYADVVWDTLNRSYQKVGGFKSAANIEELIDTPGLWKLVQRGDTITALSIYKPIEKTNNMKGIAAATETELDPGTNKYVATAQGKKDLMMIKSEDIRLNRSWVEVSGPAEKLMLKMGAKPVPNKFAEFLTGKKLLELNSDGFHYTRLIQGEPHEKLIVGFINLSPEGEAQLRSMGLDPKEIPGNI
jgi:hypothetical protein